MSYNLLAVGADLLGTYSNTASGLLPANVTPSQDHSANGKRARTGPPPGSESDEDHPPPDPSDLQATIQAAVRAYIPALVAELKPMLAAELTVEIQAKVDFQQVLQGVELQVQDDC